MVHTLIPPACWYDVGVALKLADEDDGEYLDELDTKEELDKKKFFEVLKKWLRESKQNDYVLKPATWRNLLKVLDGLSLDVQKLKDYLSKGMQVS